jgi:hypothetical protein
MIVTLLEITSPPRFNSNCTITVPDAPVRGQRIGLEALQVPENQSVVSVRAGHTELGDPVILGHRTRFRARASGVEALPSRPSPPSATSACGCGGGKLDVLGRLLLDFALLHRRCARACCVVGPTAMS